VTNPESEAFRRLSAARAAGRIQESGLVDTARELALSKGNAVERLLAAVLLARHTSGEAIEVLTQLAQDDEPTVAAAGLERLLEIDFQLAVPLAPRAVTNPDARVRMLGCRALAARLDVDSLVVLAPLLDDVNPNIRGFVAYWFLEACDDEHRKSSVINLSMETLAKASWRGIEQAALVLGYLDFEPAAPRLVELLEHDRPEALVAAAWALSMLQVRDVLPPMLDRAQLVSQRLRTVRDKRLFLALSGQLAQLYQAFGIMRYSEAEPLMREAIPKSSGYYDDPRAAACWAMGYLYAGAPDKELASQLLGRLADIESVEPEVPVVRRMCAISLGRMQARSTLRGLRKFATMEGNNTFVGRACGWSIEQMTGEVMPPAVEAQIEHLGWFLTPLDRG
jgi:HEAT repeat protein